MEQIFSRAPTPRQTVFFSATYPRSIEAMTKAHQDNPARLTVGESDGPRARSRQLAYPVDDDGRLDALLAILRASPPAPVPESAIVFCNFKATVARVEQALAAAGVSSASLHGNLEQRERDFVMAKFRNHSVRVLVATDVAARGLDIKDVPAVFNFDVPFNAEDYVHRIGRTGRAGQSGLAVTFVSPSDTRLVGDIEKLLKRKIELEAIEFEEDKPRGRINDGRRAWREAGEVGDPRDVLDAPRDREQRERAPRPQREYRAPATPRDPFFDQPYQAPATETPPAWEAGAKPATSRVSANIKTKRKVAALFKSE
jgi:ATP-dependent RNA helicase RhlE